MNDSPLYTGIDGEPNDGMFGNEAVDKETEKLLNEQKQLMAEITPKLQSLIDSIDEERKIAIDFITSYVDNSSDDDNILRGELKAAARYRKYLDSLKTKFVLALNETKRHE